MKTSTKTLTIALLMVLGFVLNTNAQAPVAAFSVNATNTLCANQTFTCYDMSTNTPTAWGYLATGATPTAAIVQNPVFTYTAPGVYNIQMLCSNMSGTAVIPAVVSLTVFAPSVTVTSSQSITSCPGTSVVLTATASPAINTYSWVAPVSVLNTVTVTPTVNTTYSVVVTGSNGCTWTKSYTQSITANPINITSSSNSICVNQSATLTAAGGTAYTWVAPLTETVAAAVITPTAAGNITYSVNATSTTCPGYTWSATFTETVSLCTGIQQNVASNVSFGVYPNPTSGEFTVELNNGVAKTIQMMDLTGRVVYSTTTSNDKVNVNVATLAKGIYYVRVQSNNTIEVAKIVVQ